MNLAELMTTVFLWLPLTQPDFAERYSPMPQPTAEVKTLIKKLGDDNWPVREKADKELRSMGFKALRGVREAMKNPDLEVRTRARHIWNSYFNVYADDKEEYLPVIWMMPDKDRYMGKEYDIDTGMATCSLCKRRDMPNDLGAWYYKRALTEYNKEAERFRWEKKNMDTCGWRDYDISRRATRLYATDLLLMGMSREKVQAQLNKMAKNARNYNNYYQTDDVSQPYNYAWDWNNFPPGPLVANEDFRDPNSYGPG